jgi:hypothetical protein
MIPDSFPSRRMLATRKEQSGENQFLRMTRPWLPLASLIVMVFLANNSTESAREHHLSSPTLIITYTISR